MGSCVGRKTVQIFNITPDSGGGKNRNWSTDHGYKKSFFFVGCFWLRCGWFIFCFFFCVELHAHWSLAGAASED